jgi:hypothetical protein
MDEADFSGLLVLEKRSGALLRPGGFVATTCALHLWMKLTCSVAEHNHVIHSEMSTQEAVAVSRYPPQVS